ncbi:winged helix-turn-helix transcriptional regulator [Rhizobium sp. ARZ01]|uniref:MarR family winged helix-turn-helix transcriptional regulator n=1 Tax=Rhizobium sp. ARZ01 TaxID=2769313 RepID=UPI001781DE43|nr:MarR family winged helix-turn-helix transcriptional regulator [Rhizobium sp. ARZ01]MBD9375147.1 winged helix-turn-helix transcriptional regulator [Rhizobium sp. ARZ01]
MSRNFSTGDDNERGTDFDLGAFLPYRLNRAAEMISLRFAAQYKARYEMTRPEWRALAALGSYGRMTATEVGANSTMHKTKVSRAVKSLEDRRWLKRTIDESDRRVEHLELTAAGFRIYREMVELARAYDRELAALLGPAGLRQLEAGLGAVENAMSPSMSKRGRASFK